MCAYAKEESSLPLSLSRRSLFSFRYDTKRPGANNAREWKHNRNIHSPHLAHESRESNISEENAKGKSCLFKLLHFEFGSTFASFLGFVRLALPLERIPTAAASLANETECLRRREKFVINKSFAPPNVGSRKTWKTSLSVCALIAQNPHICRVTSARPQSEVFSALGFRSPGLHRFHNRRCCLLFNFGFGFGSGSLSLRGLGAD